MPWFFIHFLRHFFSIIGISKTLRGKVLFCSVLFQKEIKQIGEFNYFQLIAQLVFPRCFCNLMNSYSFDLIILFNTFEKIGVLILGVRVDWVMVFEISDFKIKISGVSVFGVSVLGFRSRLCSNFWFTHCYTLLCYVHIVNVILT